MGATEATGLFPGAQSSECDGQPKKGLSERTGVQPSAVQENKVAFSLPNMKMAAKCRICMSKKTSGQLIGFL